MVDDVAARQSEAEKADERRTEDGEELRGERLGATLREDGDCREASHHDAGVEPGRLRDLEDRHRTQEVSTTGRYPRAVDGLVGDAEGREELRHGKRHEQ